MAEVPSRPIHCRQCGNPGARVFNVTVSLKTVAGNYTILVCKDCWRVFEAMLDGASMGHTPGLETAISDHRRGLFLW